ncbi:GNAT family N-acetyltransferase [Paracoccus tegillarcae]|uniref:Ribosomal-protein-alanine acetyltransferase n=1 Tax=Paracoccus tegillarcae TaxID=1529068 RepID=A0A2K9EC04_9RHOB|nr:GNAT family N-acetyltransferase [Paracoccus tegillarcae]AUH32440.1 ribosomal-protein-alanine acetyltransferase [Paracoccus tegillarcae]
MSPDALAELHRRCFDVPRPWTAAEFAGLLQGPHAFLLNRPNGFLLGRVVADEAELLTLAVAPEARRHGIGAALTRDFSSSARKRGAAEAFLEVAANNHPAIALYQAQGWQNVGRRPGYYTPEIDGLTLRLAL